MSPAAIDLRLYLVTGPPLPGADLAAMVTAAVEGGVTVVQLRAPGAATRDLVADARRLCALLDGTGVPLLIDDRLDVALASGAAGVHLGQSDLHPVDARALAAERPGFLIGWSVTAVDQVAEIASWPEGTVDYLGVGPVHPTDSKADAAEPLGYDGLGEVCRRSPLPVVAIGGIAVGDVGACLAAGAVGVAVVSAIWSAADPQAAAAALRHAVDTGW